MNIASTTLGSKILHQYKDHFSKLAVDAVLKLKVNWWLHYQLPYCLLQGSTNLEAIQIIKKLGGNLNDSYLEEGIIKFTRLYRSNQIILIGFLLEKKIGVNQPKRIENARILIANTAMDADKIKVFIINLNDFVKIFCLDIWI